MNSTTDEDDVSRGEEPSSLVPENIVIREKPRMKRGDYSVTQEQVDDLIQNELSGIRFSVKPKVNNRIGTPGKTSKRYNVEKDKYELFIEIGKQYSGSHKDLIDTLVHEELEARIIRNRHHRELYCKFVEANDDDIIHTYIQRLVDRFLLIKGVR